MRPIKFKESNLVIAENQPEYLPLPAFVHPDTKEGEVVFCMGLSWWERIYLLFTGRLWCSLLMFRNSRGRVNPLTPSFFTVRKSEMFTNYPADVAASKL